MAERHPRGSRRNTHGRAHGRAPTRCQKRGRRVFVASALARALLPPGAMDPSELDRHGLDETSPAAPTLEGKMCLIAEDDPILAAIEARRLARSGALVTVATTLLEAMQKLSASAWDVLVIGLGVPAGGVLSLAERALRQVSRPAILITSGDPDLLAMKSLPELQIPIVPKSRLANTIATWVWAALTEEACTEDSEGAQGGSCQGVHILPQLGNGRRLSKREAEVLRLLTQGKAPKEIAGKLGLRHATVRVYARNAYRKIGATNLREAFALLTMQ